jgi:hypothetical protein
LRVGESYLSGGLLETISTTPVKQLQHIKVLMGKVLPLHKKGAMVVCNAKTLAEIGTKRAKKLQAVHKPKAANPGYSGLYGLPPDNADTDLLQMLAAEGVSRCRLIKDI